MTHPKHIPQGKAEALRRQVWVTAEGLSEPLKIQFSNPKDAITFRFALYATAKAARENPGKDPALTSAVRACQVRLEGSTLIVMNAAHSEVHQAVMAALGIAGLEESEKELKTSDELATEGAFDSFRSRYGELLEQGKGETDPQNQVHNPYPRRES